MGAIIAQKISQDYALPFVVTGHYTGWLDGSIRSLHFKRGKEALLSAQVVSAVGRGLAVNLSDLLKIPIDTLNNFIDTKLFSFSSLEESSCFELVIVGDLIPRKQVNHAVDVLKILKDKNMSVRLNVVGSGHLKQQIQNYVRSLHLTDDVIFHGQVTKSQVAKIIRKSHLLLHPSKLETFGLVVVESLCSGRPVVCYNNTGSSEYEELPGVFLVNQSGQDQFAKKVEKVLINYSEIDQQKISDTAKEKFGARGYTSKLSIIYNRALKA